MHDTSRLQAMKVISWNGYLFSKPDSAYLLAQMQYDFAESKGLPYYMAEAMNTQATSYYVVGDYYTAKENYLQVLALREEIGDKKGIAGVVGNLGSIYRALGDLNKAVEFYERSRDEYKALNDYRGWGNALNNLGVVYETRGQFANALEMLQQSLELKQEIDDQQGISSCYSNMANIYGDLGDYERSLEYHLKAIDIQEAIGDLAGQAMNLNNIGTLFSEIGDRKGSLEYFQRSHDLYEELGDRQGMAQQLINLGTWANVDGDPDRAIAFFEEAAQISEEIGNLANMAAALSNLGSMYLDVMKDKEKALELYLTGLEYAESMGDKRRTAKLTDQVGNAYFQLGEVELALEYSNRALALGHELGSYEQLQESSSTLMHIERSIGNYRRALEMYELFRSSTDSMINVENQQQLIQQEYRYKYDKRTAEDSTMAAEEGRIQQAKLEAEKSRKEFHASQAKQKELEAENKAQTQDFLFMGVGLALLLGGFIANRFYVARRQKHTIEDQKDEVDRAFDELEEKNQEILDSINYARRIQTAILPTKELVAEYLPGSFILYKPKDIVAGDFYWLHPMEDRVLFAACDCTGHGVPGAMVSVVCNNGLNRAVREYNLTDPGQILDKTREIIVDEFKAGEQEVKDGMDIALVSLSRNREQNQRTESGTNENARNDAEASPALRSDSVLRYAGAHNPLWIVRRNHVIAKSEMKQSPPDQQDPSVEIASGQAQPGLRNDGYELIEIKADKQPIGQFERPLPYTTHELELNEGDTIYIFSDGYADQFGGEKGKKLKAASFKKLLLSIQGETMEQQRALIDEALETWKGDLEQLDDICVIGVRIGG